MEKPETLETAYDVPTQVETLTGFTGLSGQALSDFVKKYGLAMDADDLKCCQDYFLSERRDPTLTEIRMLDTYWSDHCRHTTFLHRTSTMSSSRTRMCRLPMRTTCAFAASSSRQDKPVTLMDHGHDRGEIPQKTGPARQAGRVRGDQRLHRQAQSRGGRRGRRTGCCCSRTRPTTTRPRSSPSAARRPASAARSATRCPGAAYVYQAMRVTGAADPTVPVERHAARQAASAQDRDHRRGRLFLLWQPDRPGDRPGGRALPPGLRGQAAGDRRGDRRGSGEERAPRGARFRATW